MMDKEISMVEVKPEVAFLYELIREVETGKVRIPIFQRPFVWRRDQMRELLDSIRSQYPIGSLLLWETEEPIASRDWVGPVHIRKNMKGLASYVLDGQQRLSSLVGVLRKPDVNRVNNANASDPDLWCIWFNAESKTFEHHKTTESPDAWHFPLWKLMNTIEFLEESGRIYQSGHQNANQFIANIQDLTRVFNSYKIPVIRLKQANLSQAVDIFSRLNSKGQTISSDQMAAALSYREDGGQPLFNLAEKIDELIGRLAEIGFGAIDRKVVLRTYMAAMEVDIYSKEWGVLTDPNRGEPSKQLPQVIDRAGNALIKAVNFLHGVGVKTARLLPYAMQLVVLGAFFLKCENPSKEQKLFLRRWFWVSSFTCRFGSSNPSQNNSIVVEFRDDVSQDMLPNSLQNMRMDTPAEPFPTDFDMRSARARTVLLVLLSLKPQDSEGHEILEPWQQIANRGPDSIGRIFATVDDKELDASPANRIFQIDMKIRAQARGWLRDLENNSDKKSRNQVLKSHAILPSMFDMLLANDVEGFLRMRMAHLMEIERNFMKVEKVKQPLDMEPKSATIDTE
jgi:hypothetical protein